jgi:ATP-dependent Clp protease protease subunit
MAASAASIIAMAGDNVEIGAASFLMIHNCLGDGDRQPPRHGRDGAFLEPFDAAMRDVYAPAHRSQARTTSRMMDAETWISGSTAIDKGFADALLAGGPGHAGRKDKGRGPARERGRAMELQLMASGLSRSQARERINKIKGTPGAAPEAARRTLPVPSWPDLCPTS